MGYSIRVEKVEESTPVREERILSDKPFLEKQVYVVDTSVALKWFSEELEEAIEKADLLREKFREREINLLAPELLVYEITNVLRYKQSLKTDDINKAIKSIFEMRILESVSEKIMKKALRLALVYEATIYDAVYLAFAESLHSSFITADAQFYRKVSKRPDTIFLQNFEEEV